MRKIFPVVLMLLLISCGSVSTPESHYYRLSSDKQYSNVIKLDKKIRIMPFKTNGLLASSYLLYSEKHRPNEVKQYHYHQWHAPLSVVLTHKMTTALKDLLGTEVRIHDYSTFMGYMIEPSLEEMEIRYVDDGAILVVKLAVIVKDEKSRIVINKKYTAEEENLTKDIYVLVSNYNTVLDIIFNQLAKDMASL